MFNWKQSNFTIEELNSKMSKAEIKEYLFEILEKMDVVNEDLDNFFKIRHYETLRQVLQLIDKQ